MEKEISFVNPPDYRNIPVSWDLLQKNRNDKGTTKKRNLPLATLVRIRGPPKVVDGFSNFNYNRTDQYPHVCTHIDIGSLEPKESLEKKKDSKPKPIILQSRQVFGRYFPKATFPHDEKGLFWKTQSGLDYSTNNKSAMKPFELRPIKSMSGPRTAQSLRSVSTSKSGNSSENRLRCVSDRKIKQERQVTFPVKRNNLVGSLSGTPKLIHSRHSAIIGDNDGVKNDIFSNKLVTVSAC